MKIAYLSDVRIPSKAASVVHVLKMCEALARMGHDVRLYYAGDGETDTGELFQCYGIDNIFSTQAVRKIPRTGLAYLYSVRVGWLAHKWRCGFVLSRNLPAAVVCALLGVPVIYEAHMGSKEKGAVTDILFEVLIRLKKLKAMLVISDALKRYYLANYRLEDKRIIVVPDAASPCRSQGGQERQNWDSAGKPKLNVGYIGHLYEGRGIDVLLEIARRCQWLHMHVVGGEPEDVRFWQERSAGIENITFYGHVDHSSTGKYRQMCDVLVAPYQTAVKVAGKRTDTVAWMSPLKIFEYMASGKPVVCSDLPVLREVLDDGRNALLCPPGDTAAWCRALKELRDNRDIRTRLGQAAYKDYRSNYTWEQRARKIVRCLEA